MNVLLKKCRIISTCDWTAITRNKKEYPPVTGVRQLEIKRKLSYSLKFRANGTENTNKWFSTYTGFIFRQSDSFCT